MAHPLQAEALALPTGYRLFPFDAIDSTNDEALRRLEAGGRHGDVVQARRQSAGRGRGGRRWHSPEGNLHASIIARLPDGREIGQIAFVAALAVGGALADMAPDGADLRYKWPNDVLLDGDKVAGILIETDLAPDGGGFAVVGVGVNLADAPADAAYRATSLAAAGWGAVSTEAAIAILCRAFEHWHRTWAADGFAPLRAAWLARAAGIGEGIEARLVDQAVRGRFLGIDDGGALMVETDGGERRIPAAEIFFARD